MKSAQHVMLVAALAAIAEVAVAVDAEWKKRDTKRGADRTAGAEAKRARKAAKRAKR